MRVSWPSERTDAGVQVEDVPGIDERVGGSDQQKAYSLTHASQRATSPPRGVAASNNL